MLLYGRREGDAGVALALSKNLGVHVLLRQDGGVGVARVAVEDR